MCASDLLDKIRPLILAAEKAKDNGDPAGETRQMDEAWGILDAALWDTKQEAIRETESEAYWRGRREAETDGGD